MRIVAVICNVVLFVFTCFVILTDGLPREAVYLIFTFLLLLVPILSSVVLSRARITSEGNDRREGRSSVCAVANCGAILCNLVLIGFSCWAIVAAYPHPKEEGAFAAATLAIYTVLVMFAPIVTVLALIGGMKGRTQERHTPAAMER